MLLIGITGRKGHGKDTVGKYLEETHGFELRAFAGTLKDIGAEVFGLNPDQLYGRYLKEVLDDRWCMTPREILQKIGTEVGREGNFGVFGRDIEVLLRAAFGRRGLTPGPSLWVDDTLKDLPERLAVTDVRFANEAQAISDLGGVLWKVVRSEVATGIREDHPSETGVDGIEPDCLLMNNDTIEALHGCIDLIWEKKKMPTKSKLKDRVKGTVRFAFYRDGALWYRAQDGWEFPVPMEETGNAQGGSATFNAEEKGIYLMRWMRKHMDKEAQDANGK